MCKRILIVDDDTATRKLFSRALEDTTYAVDTAESGERGLRLHNMFKYDLIFIDLYMPGMSGIEVLREIRKNDKEVQIYIVSAFYKEFLQEINKALDDGLIFEITHKSNTLENIALITSQALERLKMDQINEVQSPTEIVDADKGQEVTYKRLCIE